MSADVAVVTGNPKPASRTHRVAQLVAERLTGEPPGFVVDLCDLGDGLLRYGDPAVGKAVEAVRSSRIVVVASPTFKGAYTGLLKCFLDQIPTGGLAGVVAVPLMVGAGPHHALAPELMLKPVLVELGAWCPSRALYVLEDQVEAADVLDGWLAGARAAILATATAATRHRGAGPGDG